MDSGRVSESQRRRRVRIQVILTTFVIVANLIGIVVARWWSPSRSRCRACSIEGPVDHVRRRARLHRAGVHRRRHLGDQPRDQQRAVGDRGAHADPADQRNTFFAPWRLTRVLLVLWGVGTVVLTALYGLQDTDFIPKWLLGISFPGIVVSASCYLFTEFALRPVAAQALEVGPPPRRFAPGIMGRTMTVWALGPACRCSASCWPPSSRCRCRTSPRPSSPSP